MVPALIMRLIHPDNAYVGGLKEDLGFYGNELVELQTLYIVGATVGQLPFMFLFTYVPMYYLIPILDVGWGVFTLLQFRVTSFAELAAYRFLVGWFEVSLPEPCIPMLQCLTRTGCFLPSYALCIWFMVQRRRNCSPGRDLLRWPLLGHADCRSHPSRCVLATRGSTWTGWVEVDVHHMCGNHNPYWDPGVSRHPGES